MTCDLDDIFGKLAKRVPVTPGRTFSFTKDNLPIPPPQLASDKIVVQKVQYRYSGFYQVDSVWFYAQYTTFRQLALLFLSATFHAEPEVVRLDLTHSASSVKHIIIEYNYKDRGWGDIYCTQPYCLDYYADSYGPPRYPAHSPEVEDRLGFRLTNLEDEVFTEEQYQDRDTLWTTTNDRGNIAFAELLLDAGRPKERMGMYRLEDSGGVSSKLGYQSPEIRLILPSANWWKEEYWQAAE